MGTNQSESMKCDIWKEIEPDRYLRFFIAILCKGTPIHWPPTLLNRAQV